MSILIAALSKFPHLRILKLYFNQFVDENANLLENIIQCFKNLERFYLKVMNGGMTKPARHKIKAI